MSKAKQKQYIEEVPSFEELYVLRCEVDSIVGMITALSEGNDVCQRASDLKISVDNLRTMVDQLVLQE